MERIIYFSNVDQSDVSIQSQVEEYVNKLVDLENVIAPPLCFWIHDFKMAVEEAEKNNLISESLSFNEQLDYFLREYPQYDNDIAYDKEGNIWASRTKVTLRLDLNNGTCQIEFFEDQKSITTDQSVNVGREDMSFFIYNDHFGIWEFHSVAVYELAITVIP